MARLESRLRKLEKALKPPAPKDNRVFAIHTRTEPDGRSVMVFSLVSREEAAALQQGEAERRRAALEQAEARRRAGP